MKETPKHIPFVRISWEEAESILLDELRRKYNATGKLMYMHDYGYDGIGEHYEMPHFVDIYLTP